MGICQEEPTRGDLLGLLKNSNTQKKNLRIFSEPQSRRSLSIPTYSLTSQHFILKSEIMPAGGERGHLLQEQSTKEDFRCAE